MSIAMSPSLQGDWPPPHRHRPRWLRVALPIAVLALIVGIVGALGGFRSREWKMDLKNPGDTVEFGNTLEFTPIEAIVEPGDTSFRVTIFATCRNTTNEPFHPLALPQRAMQIGDPATRSLSGPTSLSFGAWSSAGDPVLNPRFTVPCQLTGEIKTMRVTGHIALLANQVSDDDQSLSGYGRTAWVPGPPAYMWILPLSVVG